MRTRLLFRRPRPIVSLLFILGISTMGGISGCMTSIGPTSHEVIESPIVSKAIYEIETKYAWDVKRTTLERHCIEGIKSHGSENLEVDPCIAAMVAGLDGLSSYYFPDRIKSLKEAQERPDVLSDKQLHPTVKSLFDGRICYIAVQKFPNKSDEEIASSLLPLLANTPPCGGIILDLRNSTGGILGSMIDVAALFLPEKTLIGYGESRRSPSRKPKEYRTPSTGTTKMNIRRSIVTITVPPRIDEKVWDFMRISPLVVLVNRKTGAGAEFLAAALKETRRALVIGSATAKEGRVRSTILLSKDRFLSLTTELLTTPSGSLIEEVGVRVDIEESNVVLPQAQGTESDVTIKQACAKLNVQLPPIYLKSEDDVANPRLQTDAPQAP